MNGVSRKTAFEIYWLSKLKKRFSKLMGPSQNIQTLSKLISTHCYKPNFFLQGKWQMKNYLRSLSHSFLMKNIDDLKQYCKRCSGMIPYYNLAKCNANICCNCHKEWSSFSWWYQIARIYTSMLEFQFNWNILFHLDIFSLLMKRLLHFLKQDFLSFFRYFWKIILSILIFVGQGICCGISFFSL